MAGNFFYKGIQLSTTTTCQTNSYPTNSYNLGITVNTAYQSIFSSGVYENPQNTNLTLPNGLDISYYNIALSNEYTSTTSINVPSWCQKCNVVLVGKGGNGGTGQNNIAQVVTNQNYNYNKQQAFYHNDNNGNYNLNQFAAGSAGAAGGGGAFTFITNISVTPSSNFNVNIDTTSSRVQCTSGEYFAKAGGDASGTTAGTAATNKSSGLVSYNGSNSQSGLINVSSSNYGYGGGGGAGGAAVQNVSEDWRGDGDWGQNAYQDCFRGGAAGSGGSSGYCKIYWLIE
jgi:hypothetical protein